MRTFTNIPVPQEKEARRQRALELRGLILATILSTVGLFWAYWSLTGPFESIPERVGDNEIVNMSRVNSVGDIRPALRVLRDSVKEDRLARQLMSDLRGRTGDGSQSSWSSEDILERVEAADTTLTLTGAEYRALESSFIVRSPSSYRWLVLQYVLLFLAGFYLVHLYWRASIGRWTVFGGDPVFLPLLMILTGVGLMVMLSLADPLRESLLFPDFIVGVLLGCAVLALTAKHLPLRRIKENWLWPFLISIGLFVGLLVKKYFENSDVQLEFVFFQPAELIKILLVIFVAGFLARFADHFRQLDERRIQFLRMFKMPPVELFATVIAAVVIILGLFFVVGELGSALILAFTFFPLYAVARHRVGLPMSGLLAVIGGFCLGYYLEVGVVANRVDMWLNPWDNYSTYGGDHLAHMLWAFAHGGFSGAGLGSASIGYIPLAQNDAILPAVGEQLGAIGILFIWGVYLLFFHRCFVTCRVSTTRFRTFLGVGFTLLLLVEVIVIAGGISGVTPLTGVVTPFLSEGKTSMIANFFIVGVLTHLSSTRVQSQSAYVRPVLWVKRVSLGVLILILGRILFVQLVGTEETLARGALVPHQWAEVVATTENGEPLRKRRYSFNPRLVALAERLGRGTIYDRNEIPLATSRRDTVQKYRDTYDQLGISLDETVQLSHSRHYPFGDLTYHLLGDVNTRHRWFATNTSFVEKEWRTHLLGYDDAYTTVDTVRDARRDTVATVPYRNYKPLVPLLRSDWNRNRFLERDRSLQLTVDIQLQDQVAQIMDSHLQRLGDSTRGAVVLLNSETGELLASVTYPWENAQEDVTGDGAGLDRARFGTYPPGSSFKIVTAIAALRLDENLYQERYPYSAGRCDGFRVNRLSMEQAVICSSNDYFATLAEEEIGASQLIEAALAFDIQIAPSNSPDSIEYYLDQTAFGQGDVTATPLEMARVAATISNEGEVPAPYWVQRTSPEMEKVLSRTGARRIGSYMRRVVTHPEGTANDIFDQRTGLAGKTGTAEMPHGRPPSAWFIGYAPHDPDGQRVAVAVIVEEGGSGGREAAPIAADAIRAAQDLGYGSER
jgi:cell division protein FtsW (lipid II flippase)